MKRFFYIIMMTFIFLAGCNTTVGSKKIDEQMYNNYLTKSFFYSKDKCFRATLAALKDSNISIEKQDREKGIIITKRSDFNSLDEDLAIFSTMISSAHQYYFQIKGGSDSSIIKVYKYRYWKNNAEQTELDYDWFESYVWNPLFNKIYLHLNNM